MPLQETSGAASYDAFGGGAADVNYIEDVFSTYLYSSAFPAVPITIQNGINLSGKGGMVWMKCRSHNTGSHVIADTSRGTGKYLAINSSPEFTDAQSVTSFNSNGFAIGTMTQINAGYGTYASWTFRKATKFFDVVTYTGNGANRTIAHNLGSVPGCIIIKELSQSDSWIVYHRSLTNTQYLTLNTADAKNSSTSMFNSTTPTSAVFSLGTDGAVNSNGDTYVAYLFAHNAGGFGLSGTDNVISCGSFTTDVVGNATVNLGYEPQWLLVKDTLSGNQYWQIVDNMRGLNTTAANAAELYAGANQAETVNGGFAINSTGFTVTQYANESYVYIAIRRGPMKVPTSGTSVFTPLINQPVSGIFQSNILTDQVWVNTKTSSSVGRTWIYDRLRGNNRILTTRGNNIQASGTDAEGTYNASTSAFQQQTGFAGDAGFTNTDYNGWFFRRAPGFMDVVCYTGTGVARTVNHNLAAVPQLMIVKDRAGAGAGNDWAVYVTSVGPTGYLTLNANTEARTVAGGYTKDPWNSTTPTTTVFSVKTDSSVNFNGFTYVAYLFATVAGVSKVGSYTGTGTTKQIDCGFTAGARFVLIKRTDSTGDWYVWDSARGIVAGNDPYLLLNSTAAEVTSTDYVDTYSAGFELSSTAPAGLNANGGTYIFLAIA